MERCPQTPAARSCEHATRRRHHQPQLAGCSVRVSAGSDASAGTGVRDKEPPGTGEADGCRGALGEDDEPLGTGEDGHRRGAPGAAPGHDHARSAARSGLRANRDPRLFCFNESSALIRRTRMRGGVKSRYLN